MQILVTELGDETFIIAAIMAMRHPRLVVYAGAMSALGFMTVRPSLPAAAVRGPASLFVTGLMRHYCDGQKLTQSRH